MGPNSDDQTGVSRCQVVELPKIHAPEGNLTFIEEMSHIPFMIRRVYYLYDVPGGAARGAHAHRSLWQLMVSMSGSFDVELDDGSHRRTVHLNRSYFGLIICPMILASAVKLFLGIGVHGAGFRTVFCRRLHP